MTCTVPEHADSHATRPFDFVYVFQANDPDSYAPLATIYANCSFHVRTLRRYDSEKLTVKSQENYEA